MTKIITPLLLLLIVNACFGQSPNFTYSQTCYGQQTILVGSSSLPDTAITSWQWDMDGDGVYDLNSKTIVYFFTANDTVAVKLKITPNYGTPDSITKNVIIDPLPNVNFIVDNLCTGSIATYSGACTISVGFISQYLWDFDNNGTTDNSSNDTVTFACGGTPNTYFSRLTCVSDKGCSAFATKTIQVFQTPTASFSIADTCLNDNTLFTNWSTINSPDYYRWDFGDGFQSTTSGNANHIYTAIGNYNVSLIAVTMNGCRDTSGVKVVNIHALPVITIDTSGSTHIFEGGSVTLTASGASSYLWNPSSTSASSVVVSQSGTYTVLGTDNIGCSATAEISVTKFVTPDTVAVSSNILTPNGDGINDFLIIDNKEAYTSCILQVYNMWNVEVYSKEGYNNDWDGTSNGKVLPDGAYYYMITCDDKPMLKGNINILLK